MADKNEKKFSARGRLTSQQKSLFIAKTPFHKYDIYGNTDGRVASPFREMVIGQRFEPGRHAKKSFGTTWYTDKRALELPSNYSGSGGKWKKGKFVTRENWEAFQNTGEIIQIDKRQFYRHLVTVAHQLPIATEHWKLVLAHRALAVFQESFKLKRFNSSGTSRWKVNTEWTRKKRKWKGTWPGAGKLMQETNALFNSLHISKSPFVGVVAEARYAGVHNCPEPGMTYGNGFGGRYSPPKPVTQRQFMGHSTQMDDFIATYERRYLFDTIFRRPV